MKSMSEIGSEEALKSPEIAEFLKDLYWSYGFILKKICIEVMYLSCAFDSKHTLYFRSHSKEVSSDDSLLKSNANEALNAE
jgi:hypothetical protein